MRNHPGTSSLAALVVAALALPACVDHMYRHEVGGRVVDPSGLPVAEAEVLRTYGPGPDAVSGDPAHCRRTTDEDGTFLFEESGLGDEPEESQTWYLRASAAGFQPRAEALDVPWVDGTNGSPPQGYVLRDIELVLEPAPPRTWIVWVDDLRLLEISDRPGPIVDSTAPPPPPSPDGPPPPHPFLTAGCGGDPVLCSRAGQLLRASRSLDEFLAALAAEGWRVEETTPAP